MAQDVPAPVPGPVSQYNSQATASLVTGILGIVCCGLVAPVAWFLGSRELKRIQAGQIIGANEGLARAGMILGIIGSILLVLSVIWLIFLGGLAIVGEMNNF